MTATRGLFVRQTGTAPNAIGTTPLEARLALAGLFAENSPGVPRSGILPQNAVNLVTASATDQSYNITGCTPVVNRATNEGIYVFSLTGTTNAQSSNAPGTGSRFDLVYVRQHDPDKGDPDNLPEFGVVVGQSSTGTPTKPYASVPAGGYVVAEAQIFSGTTAANGGANTLTQVWVHTAPRGVAIPVRNQTERDAITVFNGLTVKRLDVGGTVESYISGAWVRAAGSQHFETTFGIVPPAAATTGVGTWTPPSPDLTTDTTIVNAATPSQLTLNTPGIYSVSIVHGIANASGLTRAFIQLVVAGGDTIRSNIPTNEDHSTLSMPNLRITAATTLTVQVFQQGIASAAWTGHVRITKVG